MKRLAYLFVMVSFISLTGIATVHSSAAPDSDLELVVATEPDRGDDVLDASRPHDQRGTTVEDCVPHPSGVVVVDRVRLDDLAREMATELVGLWARGRHGHATRVGAGSVLVSSRVFGRAMTAEASRTSAAAMSSPGIPRALRHHGMRRRSRLPA